MFGKENYEVLSDLAFTGGVSWTLDKRTVQIQAYIFDAAGLGLELTARPTTYSRFLVHTNPELSVGRSWPKWSGRGILSYEISEGWLAYVGIARRFNGGSLFDPLDASLANPEFVTSHETGLRGQTRNQLFRVGLFGFYYDFTNPQEIPTNLRRQPYGIRA